MDEDVRARLVRLLAKPKATKKRKVSKVSPADGTSINAYPPQPLVEIVGNTHTKNARGRRSKRTNWKPRGGRARQPPPWRQTLCPPQPPPCCCPCLEGCARCSPAFRSQSMAPMRGDTGATAISFPTPGTAFSPAASLSFPVSHASFGSTEGCVLVDLRNAPFSMFRWLLISDESNKPSSDTD